MELQCNIKEILKANENCQRIQWKYGENLKSIENCGNLLAIKWK